MSIRVLQVVTHLGHRGADQQMCLLSQSLHLDQFDVHVCALGCCPSQRQTLEKAGIPVTILGRQSAAANPIRSPRSWTFPTHFCHLVEHVDRLSPDVVHTWSNTSHSSDTRFARLAIVLAGRLQRTDKTKFVSSHWMLNSADGESDPERTNALRAVDRLLDRFTQRIIQPRMSTSNVLTSNVFAGQHEPKQVAIPLGVPSLPGPSWSQRHELMREAGLPAGAKLIVAYSDYSTESRFKDAIWAADLLKVIRDDTHLILIGDGPLLWRGQRFRDQVEIRDRVHLVSDCCHMERWIPHANCFWDVDGLSHSLHFTAMAMANGIPILTADTPASRDLLGDDGAKYFALGHRGGLARHCQEVLEDEDLAASLSIHVRARASKFLSLDEMSRSYADVYRAVVHLRV